MGRGQKAVPSTKPGQNVDGTTENRVNIKRSIVCVCKKGGAGINLHHPLTYTREWNSRLLPFIYSHTAIMDHFAMIYIPIIWLNGINHLIFFPPQVVIDINRAHSTIDHIKR